MQTQSTEVDQTLSEPTERLLVGWMVFRLHISVLPHSLTGSPQASWNPVVEFVSPLCRTEKIRDNFKKKLRIFSGKRIFCRRRRCCIRWHTALETLQTHQYFWRTHVHFGRTQKFLECDLYLISHWAGKWICSSTISSAILLPASLHAPNDLVSVCWLFSISRGSLNYSGNPRNALWSKP